MGSRAASRGRLKGLKLHFGGALLDFKSPEQVARVRRVMETANRLRMPIIVHVRSSGTYGREDADIFLYESDAGKGTPRAAWAAFRTELPLTDEEFRTIANNVAPYMMHDP